VNPDERLVAALLENGARMALIVDGCLAAGMSPNRARAVVKRQCRDAIADAASDKIIQLVVSHRKGEHIT